MQKHSSKNTSVNTTKLPAIYNKIEWHRYSHPVNYHVFDIGCGKLETQHLIYNKLRQHKIKNFYPWDPNHKCLGNKIKTITAMNNIDTNKVIICSNVLNVIDDDSSLNALIAFICDMSVIREPSGVYRMNPVYITVYEGDKSGIGRETKRDCWQRNERLIFYLDKFNNYIKQQYCHNANFFRIKYGMIIGAIQYGGHISYETERT